MKTWRVTFHCSFDIEQTDEIADEDTAEETAWAMLVELAGSGCSPDDFPAVVEEVG